MKLRMDWYLTLQLQFRINVLWRYNQSKDIINQEWQYVKDKLFSTPVPDITNLKARITDAFATITEDMLYNMWRETDYQLDILRATKEHMLKCTNVL